MSQKPSNEKLIESVPHKTMGRAFSLHHTDVSHEGSSALYLHCHTELEFFYLCSGELYFYVEDCQYHLKQGDIILIPGGLIHYATRIENTPSKCSFDAMVFSSDFILEALPPYFKKYLTNTFLNLPSHVCHLHSDSKNSWELNAIHQISGIFSFRDAPLELCELQIRGLTFVAWQLLYNNFFSKLHEKEENISFHSSIDTCISIINDDYFSNHSLAELAKTAGLSEGHFCRTFKSVTGFTPFQYINRVRIMKACELLTRTNQSITDISTTCGFNNISYFNRIFKQIMKESPSIYRKNFLNS